LVAPRALAEAPRPVTSALTTADAVPPTSHETTAESALSPSQRSAEPREIGGLLRPSVEPGDASRRAATVVLLPLRKLFEIQFYVAERLIELGRFLNFGPRASALMSPQEGEVKVLPTFFFESRHPVAFGIRVVAPTRLGESSVAIASGGPNDIFAQSQVVLRVQRPLEAEVTLATMYDRRNSLELFGVGQVPDEDARNVYRATAATHDGLYLEQRTRLILIVDATLLRGIHLVGSGALELNRVVDAVDAGEAGISKVFERIEGFSNGASSRVLYGELALRFFTRRNWTSADPGAQLEAYVGYGAGVDEDPARYWSAGGRAAVFIPVVRASNTLSPKIVLDAISPERGPFPFTLLVRQPDYRGFDLRRDQVSVVTSLDYRWIIARYIALRLFVDAATVAPTFSSLVAKPPRVAGGFGIDVFNTKTDTARVGFSGSADGLRVLINLGWSAAAGDRVRRN
jgi:hypothetical protein